MSLRKMSAVAKWVFAGTKSTPSCVTTVLWCVVIGLLQASPVSADCGFFGGNACDSGCPAYCNMVICPQHWCACDSCRTGCSPGPCGSGCPDECSAIVCSGNALCRSSCGGSSCNVGCSPGPCGSGCPDHCSTAICPQNHCDSACNPHPQCDILCGGDPCNSGCPDACSVVVCPQNSCDPACNPHPQCDILCGGDPCNSGCPDECSPILCAQNPCSGQTPCGGSGERGCCVFEQVPSCDPGLVEDAPCTNSDCGFLGCSAGTCIAPACGGVDQRACCFGEESIVVGHTCEAGLVEVNGCSGDCACTGLTAIGSSTSTCVDSPCGGKGQRACCVGDPGGSGTGLFGAGCHTGLVEKGSCLDILGASQCGPGLIPCSLGVCVEITPCGGEGQRACCLLEDVTIGACGSGLVENGSCDSTLGITNCFCGGASLVRSSGVCRAPDCGGPGQRGCCLLERIPSCDPGLIEDLTPGCLADAPPGGCACGFGPGFSLGVCRPLKGLGETDCDTVFDPCASGLQCLATENNTICVPQKGDGLFSDSVCAAFYNPLLHQAAINSGITMTYGTAASASAGVTGSLEVGVGYGADGCYGCYFTRCIGVDFDTAIGVAACLGQGFDGLFDSLAGDSCVFTVGADFPFVEVGGSVSTGWVGSGVEDCSSTPKPASSSACFSVGLGINPVQTAFSLCNTVTNLVACTDNSVSADGDMVLTPNQLPTCVNGVTFVACPGTSLDLMPIAIDPDGDPLTYQWSTDCPGGTFNDNTKAAPTLTWASAPGCAAMNCSLTVTAHGTDAGGNPTDVVCTASVTNDSRAPEFTAFPTDLTITTGENTNPILTGTPSAADSCGSSSTITLSFSDSAVGACPQDQILTRTWTAADACGNSLSQDQIITEVGYPGDFNGDGGVDIFDFTMLHACLFGPGSQAQNDCLCMDKNGNGHVGLREVADFMTQYIGFQQ